MDKSPILAVISGYWIDIGQININMPTTTLNLMHRIVMMKIKYGCVFWFHAYWIEFFHRFECEHDQVDNIGYYAGDVIS